VCSSFIQSEFVWEMFGKQVEKNTTLSGQKIKSSKHVEIGTIYTFDTQKYDRSLSWFGTCTLIGGVVWGKLVI
jgi:hypothetical protein